MESAVDLVKRAIAEIVAAEDKNAPLSDDQIRIALEARDMVMTVETVAKFRERLGVPIRTKRRVRG